MSAVTTTAESPQLSVDNRLGVCQRIEFVTKASALDLKIPKSNVDNVVRRATEKEHARTRK